MQTTFIGVDVSKAELVISVGDQAAVSVANVTESHRFPWRLNPLRGLSHEQQNK